MPLSEIQGQFSTPAREANPATRAERKFPKGQWMSTYDREPREKLQRMESIEARLARYHKTTHLGLIWLSALGIVLLALMVYIITRL
jgi:hypothetical protein